MQDPFGKLELTRDERVRRCGVDCADAVVWRHWGVGGEYVKKLTIKNTYDKLQVLEYHLPQRKATFFVDFPQPVTLSSGMAYDLEIRFRPTELVEFHDRIQIDVKGRGSFVIALDALTPYAKLEVPDKHDFQFCAVGAPAVAETVISNVGTVPLDFFWEVPAPFTIKPTSAALSEGEKLKITCTFTPQEATAMVCRAVCKDSRTNAILASMAMSGVGKFAFINPIEPPDLEFGKVLTGTTAQRFVMVQNKSTVDAVFSVKRADRDIVCPFVVTPSKGVIPRDGRVKFTVKYVPVSTDAQYSNEFAIRTVGGNTLTLNCTGTAVGPVVTLSAASLDFGDVDIDNLGATPLEKFIVLTNSAPTAVRFQFLATNPGAAFVVTPCTGTVAAKGSQNIRVRFVPTQPLNYLRRLFLLVNHTKQALFIDALGTGYNAKQRPAPFTAQQARVFFARLELGLGQSTPDDLNKLLEGIAHNGPCGEDEQAARDAMRAALDAADGEQRKRRASLSKLLPSVDGSQPFMLDRPQVIIRGSSGDGQTVVVKNNTAAKATAFWAAPAGGMWSVTPETQDVSPFSTATFKVSLAKDAPTTTSFGTFLECFVNFKQMRSFRLVSENTFCPPQCLMLQCQRLAVSNDTVASPQVEAAMQIAFPACHEKDEVFQVISLTNQGDTVCAFDVLVEAQRVGGAAATSDDGPHPGDSPDAASPSTGQVFTVYPGAGTIPPKEQVLLLAKFSPPNTARFVGVARVILNDQPAGALSIALRGEGYVPKLDLANNGMLTFRPTSVGGQSIRTYTVQNPSRIAVKFEAIIPEHLERVFQLHPRAGILRGCEKLELAATFTPEAIRRYDAKFAVNVVAQNPPAHLADPVPTRQWCHVSGEGLVAVIAIEPLEIQFGSVLVGTSSSAAFTLFNSSMCDAYYDVRSLLVKGGTADGELADVPTPSFRPAQGIIRARSHVNVEATVAPKRGSYEFLFYVIVGGSEAIYSVADPIPSDVERLPHCRATTAGGHPTLQVTDIRSVYQSKSHLWRQFSISTINGILNEIVTERDVEKTSFTFQQAVDGLESIFCDLGVDVFRSTPIRVLCRLDNVGHCPVGLKFWLPHENDIPKEQWHDGSGSCPEDVAAVIDKQLFDISPRQATIEPGGHIVITFSYRHVAVGQHRLPVLLRIGQGKKLLLELSASTLHETARFLSFHRSMQHKFLPVPIGDLEPPLQYTELRNLSHLAVNYAIDEASLAQLRDENFDFPVFQCLNPKGSIPAMSTLLLSWYFRPLESKTYETTVLITVEDGDTYPIKISGAGYHPNKVSVIDVRKMHEQDALPLPKFPALKHPSLPLRLSLDVLKFGAIPFHSLHRQFIALHNDHPCDTFLYEWHSVLQFGDQIFDMQPPRGRIAAGQTVHCRITMYSGSTSHVIDNPIHCHLLNEDLRQRRLAKRATIEQEKAMKLDATNSEPELAAAAGASSSTRAKERQSITTVPAKFQSTQRLKSAIQQLTEAAVSEAKDENDEGLVYVDVQPTVLEVLVQARIMPIDKYKQIYGEIAAKSLYFPTLQAYSDTLPSGTVPLADCSAEEKTLVHGVLDDIIKHVVRNPLVIDAFGDTSEDPVPFFCEFAARPEGDDDNAATVVEDEPSLTYPSVVSGELHCLIEEVLEAALFDVVDHAQERDGIVSNVIARRSIAAQSLQRGTRKSTTERHANAVPVK